MSPDRTVTEQSDAFLYQVKQNGPGLIGFGLSVLQLVIHGCWLAFVVWLTANGQAERLESGAWQLWVITIMIILGAVVTMISLFLCLYGAIHGSPKSLAVLGLCISFFVGALTTFALLINASAGGT